MFSNGSDQDWYSHSNSLIQIKFTIVLHLMNINQTRKALVWLYIKFLPLPFYISKRQKLLRLRTNFCPTTESLSLFYFVTSPPQHIICWKTHFPENSLLQKWDKKLRCHVSVVSLPADIVIALKWAAKKLFFQLKQNTKH